MAGVSRRGSLAFPGGTEGRWRTRQAGGRARILLGFVVSMAIALYIPAAPSAVATTYPYAAISHYEPDASTTRMNQEGKSDASSVGSNKGTVVIILDFCRPAWNSAIQEFGAYTCFTNNFESNPAINNAIEAYSDGWASVGPAGTSPILARGTSNNCTTCSPYTVSNFTNFGYYWASKTSEWQSYMNQKGYTRQTAWGGVDFEPAWNATYTNSKNIADGYASLTGAQAYADFGSADSSWSNDKIYHVSFGVTPAWPFPEIYHFNGGQTMATEWQGVDQWAHNNGHGYTVRGVTDDYNPGNGCTLTPNGAYDVLEGKISAWQSAIDYATKFPC